VGYPLLSGAREYQMQLCVVLNHLKVYAFFLSQTIH
jgi:hypothetical protein